MRSRFTGIYLELTRKGLETQKRQRNIRVLNRRSQRSRREILRISAFSYLKGFSNGLYLAIRRDNTHDRIAGVGHQPRLSRHVSPAPAGPSGHLQSDVAIKKNGSPRRFALPVHSDAVLRVDQFTNLIGLLRIAKLLRLL